MSDLQRIVSVLPNGKMNHNVMRNLISLLGTAIESRGVEHVTLDGEDPAFQRDLLNHATDPGSAIYLGHRFFDLGLIHAEAGGYARRNLFEVLERPVFAEIQDHPYSRFMWSRIEAASRTTHFLLPTPEFQAEAQFINPALVRFHKASPTMTEPPASERENKPLAERPVDIFMSCAFFTSAPSLERLARHYASKSSPMKKVIDEVYETGMAERDRPLLALFLEAFERHFGKPLTMESPMTRGDRAALEVLSCIDTRIRFDRRIKVLRGLARLDPALRIVVTAAPSYRDEIRQLRDRPNIELVGRIEAARARKLFLQSKFAINVQPTYVSFVTERVSNAMALGCCVISDKNRHLATTFSEGREILFLDDLDAGALHRFFRDDLDEAQAIATRGHRRALTEFPVSKLADDLIAVMRKVL